MKTLRYFIILLFVFSCGLVFAQEQEIDYKQWIKEHELIILKSEKRAIERAKTDQEREKLIELFWEARDPDQFTFKNERKLSYQKNLEKARKDYPDLKDYRRYIYLLYGEPKTKHFFSDQVIKISNPSNIRVRISKVEIWYYKFGTQKFQVIFAKASPYQLQQIRDQYRNSGLSSVSPRSSDYEILYIGLNRYANITVFLKDFFQENFRLQATLDIINNLKKSILDMANKFYKNSKPRVKKEKYVYEWKEGLRISINQFEINSPEEIGIDIWLSFSKDSLYYDSKKKEYKTEVSLFCSFKDINDKEIIYHCDDKVEYKFKKEKSFYYHLCGSLSKGDYKFVIEVGDNIGKRYIRIEEFEEEVNGRKVKKDIIKIRDYSKPGLKARLCVGRLIKERERVKGKPSYFFFKEGVFCPAVKGDIFREKDELVAIFDVLGFEKNHYGNPHLETSLSFIKGEIKDREFVPTGEVYKYPFSPFEEDASRLQRSVKIKIEELGKNFKPSTGLYRVSLFVRDAVANSEGSKEYPCTILIIRNAK